MTSVDTYLYDLSIPAISSLQSSLASHAQLMQLISVVFDPKYAFLIYSPIAYLVDHRVGRKLILTTVIAEWLNMILKWMLHGDRPYWYVHSSRKFDTQATPIEQFPITCELGPGHPSGHAMVTAAVWYIILDSFVRPALSSTTTTTPTGDQTTKDTQSKTTSSTFGSTLPAALVYLALLVTVSVSRVFLGCHFPHQCLAGALLGYLVARGVSQLDSRGGHFVGVSVAMFASAFATYYALGALGYDPSWTIRLATKHCVKREYIHLDTAPLFSIMRYCGFALGTGLGLIVPAKRLVESLSPAGHAPVSGREAGEKPAWSRQASWFSVKLLMALLMARLVDNLGLFVSHSNLSLFYAAAFASYTAFSFAFVNL